MPKSSAPFQSPQGRKWCPKHNNESGAYLPISAFPDEKYSYCRECKRDYQRKWDKTKRIRPKSVASPAAKLSSDKRRIIIHLPNNEKGRNVTREVFDRYPDSDYTL